MIYKRLLPKRFQLTFRAFAGLVGLCVLFIAAAIALPLLSSSCYYINIGRLSVVNLSLCGILSGIELMVLACLVIFYKKLGLLLAAFFSTTSVITNFIPILLYGKLNSFAGIVFNSFGLAICILIYRNDEMLNQQNIRLESYNQSLCEQQERLHHLAYYDSLTDLPNRRNMVGILNSICTSDSSVPFHLIVIDLNHFKKVYDVVGHQKGDDLLNEFIKSWNTFLHKDDLLGRIDSHEFALLIQRPLNREELTSYMDDFRTFVYDKLACIGLFPSGGSSSSGSQGLILSANFGVVSHPEHSFTAEELFLFADTALSISKKTGPNTVCYFTKDMYEEQFQKAVLESALSRSLVNNECFLVFQPQFTAQGTEVRGFETLVRWKNASLGHVPPNVFIPLAEETGFILPLGEWVLKTAIREFQELDKACDRALILSVNLSVLQILHPDFIDMVSRTLEETEFPPSQLEFEITESIFISDKADMVSILTKIKQLGITIALDDFGTSYSSLSYIKDLPFDLLKIDKTFVDAILEDTKKAQLVDTILAIARQMDYKVVAEGVETQQQLSYLQERSCDYIQGYLLGKPMSTEEAAHLL